MSTTNDLSAEFLVKPIYSQDASAEYARLKGLDPRLAPLTSYPGKKIAAWIFSVGDRIWLLRRSVRLEAEGKIFTIPGWTLIGARLSAFTKSEDEINPEREVIAKAKLLCGTNELCVLTRGQNHPHQIIDSEMQQVGRNAEKSFPGLRVNQIYFVRRFRRSTVRFQTTQNFDFRLTTKPVGERIKSGVAVRYNAFVKRHKLLADCVVDFVRFWVYEIEFTHNRAFCQFLYSTRIGSKPRSVLSELKGPFLLGFETTDFPNPALGRLAPAWLALDAGLEICSLFSFDSLTVLATHHATDDQAQNKFQVDQVRYFIQSYFGPSVVPAVDVLAVGEKPSKQLIAFKIHLTRTRFRDELERRVRSTFERKKMKKNV